jgi:Icc-related predicted phosphoesterase
MPACLFASDLHGRVDRYHKLFDAVRASRPAAVFLGGDLLPSAWLAASASDPADDEFVRGFLGEHLGRLRDDMGPGYPAIFVILGNDDARVEEGAVAEVAARGLWEYAHARRIEWAGFAVFGYACVPPTPFMLKDWERYDVSRFVDPGCVPPEEGFRTVPVPQHTVTHGTIQGDLGALAGDADLARSIWLFHAPPHRTVLDRAALDGKMVDFAPLDVHVGSVAIRRFIERRQPLVTLHGHVHESARLTGEWHTRIGRTHAMSAAHDGPELALVHFDPDEPGSATRDLR